MESFVENVKSLLNDSKMLGRTRNAHIVKAGINLIKYILLRLLEMCLMEFNFNSTSSD